MATYLEELLAQRQGATGLGGNHHVSGGGFDQVGGISQAHIIQYCRKLEQEMRVMAQVLAAHDHQLRPLAQLMATGGATVGGTAQGQTPKLTMSQFNNPVDRSMMMVNNLNDDMFGESSNFISDYPEAERIIKEGPITGQETHFTPQTETVQQETKVMQTPFQIGYPIKSPITDKKGGSGTFTFNKSLLKSEDLKVMLSVKSMNTTDVEEGEDLPVDASAFQYPVLVSNIDMIKIEKDLWVKTCGNNMTVFVNQFIDLISTTNDPQVLEYLIHINSILTTQVNEMVAFPKLGITIDSFTTDLGDLTIRAKERLSPTDYAMYKLDLEDIIGRVIFLPLNTFNQNIEDADEIKHYGFMYYAEVVMLPVISAVTGLNKVPFVETQINLNDPENGLIKAIVDKNKENYFHILTKDDVEVVVRKDRIDNYYIKRV